MEAGKGSNSNNRARGSSRGRQKIEMKKISNPDDLLISFSKRRAGIYKKASELVILCGAEVAAVVFSPSGKPFSYGHPSVHHVLSKFTPTPDDVNAPPLSSSAGGHVILEAHRRRRVAELSERHDGLFAELGTERARRKRLQRDGAAAAAWWEAPLDGLAVQQLRERRRALAEIHAAVCGHVEARTGGGDAAAAAFSGGATARAGTGSSTTGFSNGYNHGFGGYGNCIS